MQVTKLWRGVFNQAESETGSWFCSETVNGSAQWPEPSVQRVASNVQSPESRVQRPTLASRVQEFQYAIISLRIAFSGSSHRSCYVKKLFLKMSQNSQENIGARVSFWHSCFHVNFAKISSSTFFKIHLWVVASISFKEYFYNKSFYLWFNRSV